MSAKKYRVGFRTARPVEQIENWLSKNCQGAWDVRLMDIADDLRHKTLSVYFQSEDDARLFKQSLSAEARRQAAKEKTWSPGQLGTARPAFNYG